MKKSDARKKTGKNEKNTKLKKRFFFTTLGVTTGLLGCVYVGALVCALELRLLVLLVLVED